jgi:hypothetical protein
MQIKKSVSTLIMMLLINFSTQATTMNQIGIRNLAQGAEKIVQAKVTAVVTQWNNNQTVIYTYVRMNIVDDLITGDQDREIIIKQPGGTIGTLTLAVSGTSRYQVGEENVLFLTKDLWTPSTFQTMGMFQGKYKVILDTSNVQRVTIDTTQINTLYKKSPNALVEAGNMMTLNDFKKMVVQLRSDTTSMKK